MNEYIGDSGKELEGAAEQIVESYMGEYMQVAILLFNVSNGQLGVHEGLVQRLLRKDWRVLRPGYFCISVILLNLHITQIPWISKS